MTKKNNIIVPDSIKQEQQKKQMAAQLTLGKTHAVLEAFKMKIILMQLTNNPVITEEEKNRITKSVEHINNFIDMYHDELKILEEKGLLQRKPKND
tara:strand:+ start:111 stop:398 length:288 start_codon:yes stop_codon:yes gene_type:complete